MVQIKKNASFLVQYGMDGNLISIEQVNTKINKIDAKIVNRFFKIMLGEEASCHSD